MALVQAFQHNALLQRSKVPIGKVEFSGAWKQFWQDALLVPPISINYIHCACAQ